MTLMNLKRNGGSFGNNMKNLVDIIIVRYNTLKYDLECVQSILTETKYEPYMITLFDNYPIKMNLATLWNLLIKKSPAKYVLLLNNDTKVYASSISSMMETMLSDKKIGAVSPSTNQCGNVQKLEAIDGQIIIPKVRQEVDMELTYGKKWQLSGFCLLLRKQAWKDVGGFDDKKYNFYGLENEFLHRVQQKGYKTIWRADAFVYHYGSQSAKKTGKDYSEEKRRVNKLYQEAINE